MVDPLDALRSSGGAARLADLERLGVDRRRLARATVHGAVVRHAPGLYALPGCASPHLARAAVGGARAALSCQDALVEHGLTVIDVDPRPHVVVGRGTVRTWPGTVVHRTGAHDGAPRLGLVPALLSAGRCAGLRSAVGAVDQALREGRCSRADLDSAGGHARWRRVLSLSDPRAGSTTESFARVHLTVALSGLGASIEPQANLWGVGHVDLLVDGWLVVEVDGFAFHSDRASYREDRRRNGVLSRHGYVWLRPTFEDVVRRPAWMVDEVRETWSRGRPPGWVDLQVP